MKSMPAFTARPSWLVSLLIVLVGLISLIGPASLFANTIQSDYDVGVNDFRISDVGPAGETSFEAVSPALVYSEKDNEYLAVWSGDDTTQFEYEIYGQRLSTAGGVVVQP